MCCESDSAPKPEETVFSKTLADIMKERQENARKFQPLEDRLIGDVEKFGTAEYEEEQAGKAIASADDAADAAAGASDRNLASMGVNPNSGAYASRNRMLTLGRSLSRVSAGQNARDSTRRLAFDTLAGVSGRGDAKVGQAISAAGSGGQLYNQSQANAINARGQDDGMGGFGQLLGVGLSMFSSRRLKKNVRPSKAMEAARDMPVKDWTYKGDDEEHTGPMAEDAAKAIGGDGLTLNVGDVAGVALGATQDLDRRLRRLEARK